MVACSGSLHASSAARQAQSTIVGSTPDKHEREHEHDAIIVESEGHTRHAHARIAASGFNDLDIQGEGQRRPREA